MGGGYLSDAAFLSGTASAGGGGRIPFRPVLTPGRTAKDRTSTHQRKDYDMNDEKKIGFSVELENNRVDLWAHGDYETLVNLAVAATANIVAAACGNDVKEAEKLLQDVKTGLDVALDQALEHPTRKSTRKTSRLLVPLICLPNLWARLDFGGTRHGRTRRIFPERTVQADVY